MMKSAFQEFSEALSAAKRVVIGTHLNPDGDALGSALGMSHYLDSLGIENEVLCHHEPPQNLLFLPGVDRIRQTPKAESFDLGIICDLDSTERLGSTAPWFEACPKIIVIDHHVPHEKPGDLRIIDQTAAAAAAIIARMFFALGATITPSMATCLLTGIVTDTGSFRFRNTNSEALVLAGRLLECGGNIGLICEEIFQRKPLASARLLGWVLEHMELLSNDQIAWGSVSYDQFQRAGARDEDTEGFVNDLLAIETVQIAALFRETKPNWIRVSLRCRNEYDVAEVAREFGGGGHKLAAGCSFDLPLSEAIEIFVPRLVKCLESS